MYLKSRFFYILPFFILGLLGYILINATFYEVVSVYFVYFLLYSFGVSFGCHTVSCHSEIKVHPYVDYFFKCISAFCFLGAPIWQKAAHLSHHKWAETEKDCQPVTVQQLRGYSDINKIDRRCIAQAIRQETRFDLFVTKYYYFMILLIHGSLFLVLGLKYYIFFALFPSVLSLFSVYLLRIFGHIHFLNYKNNSGPGYNTPWLFFFVFDDAWHNNHHNERDVNKTSYRWFEPRLNNIWRRLFV